VVIKSGLTVYKFVDKWLMTFVYAGREREGGGGERERERDKQEHWSIYLVATFHHEK
jgi:hypothetical protein